MGDIKTKEPRAWVCQYCNSFNKLDVDVCIYCNAHRTADCKLDYIKFGEDNKPVGEEKRENPVEKPKKVVHNSRLSWTCAKCGAKNPLSAQRCEQCNGLFSVRAKKGVIGCTTSLAIFVAFFFFILFLSSH